VQSALTVYVPETCALRVICPLALPEKTVSTLPLPSKTSYPALANGSWSFPLISTPSGANRYVPFSLVAAGIYLRYVLIIYSLSLLSTLSLLHLRCVYNARRRNRRCKWIDSRN
jgi:hypothetical protein